MVCLSMPLSLTLCVTPCLGAAAFRDLWHAHLSASPQGLFAPSRSLTHHVAPCLELVTYCSHLGDLCHPYLGLAALKICCQLPAATSETCGCVLGN